jgi:hypothetical protein
MIDLWREICKPVLKLDFTAHALWSMESLSNFDSGFDLRILRYVGIGGTADEAVLNKLYK